jgi:hypothetical protein
LQRLAGECIDLPDVEFHLSTLSFPSKRESNSLFCDVNPKVGRPLSRA